MAQIVSLRGKGINLVSAVCLPAVSGSLGAAVLTLPCWVCAQAGAEPCSLTVQGLGCVRGKELALVHV